MNERRYNVILIVSDTFRFDLLTGFRVRNRVARVPRLSRFASEYIVFSRAYTASFPTVPHRHDLSISRFTFSGWEPLPRDEATLPMTLKNVWLYGHVDC
uniref:Sulfatase N-terminal domain-containing protein n=1 Tax=Ignisphaera aggregans TaxID=334771 RepID=A0A7C4BBM1_9CREN